MKELSVIKSVIKAFAILEAVATGGGELSTTEIAKRLGHDVSTVHNLIKTLEYKKYLAYAPTGRSYCLGPAIIKLLDGTLLEDELARRLAPMAQELSAEIDENVVVSCLEGGEWRRIIRIDAGHSLTVNTDHLEHPLYSYAAGRLLLALMDGVERERLIGEVGLPGSLWSEAGTGRKLARELDRIRSDGYAIVQAASGVTAIAAPLLIGKAKKQLALSAFFPTSRADKVRENEIIEKLLTACQRMANKPSIREFPAYS
jgi:IclR family acetate operon transcriptional repressor